MAKKNQSLLKAGYHRLVTDTLRLALAEWMRLRENNKLAHLRAGTAMGSEESAMKPFLLLFSQIHDFNGEARGATGHGQVKSLTPIVWHPQPQCTGSHTIGDSVRSCARMRLWQAGGRSDRRGLRALRNGGRCSGERATWGERHHLGVWRRLEEKDTWW